MTKSSKFAASLAVAVCLTGWAGSAAASDFTSRSGGASETEMLSRSNPLPADGLAFVRPVLTGIMYRAGFKGGDKSRTGLSTAQRGQLCEAGFFRSILCGFWKEYRLRPDLLRIGRTQLRVGPLFASRCRDESCA